MSFTNRLQQKLEALRSEGYTDIHDEWVNSTELYISARKDSFDKLRILYIGSDYEYVFWCNDNQGTLSEIEPRVHINEEDYVL